MESNELYGFLVLKSCQAPEQSNRLDTQGTQENSLIENLVETDSLN